METFTYEPLLTYPSERKTKEDLQDDAKSTITKLSSNTINSEKSQSTKFGSVSSNKESEEFSHPITAPGSLVKEIILTPTKNDENKENENPNTETKLNKSASNISESSLLHEPPLNFLPNPHLKNLNYIESKIPLYANLFRLQLKKNYEFYEYALDFIFDGDNHNPIPTFLKRKIILKVGAAEIIPRYGNFIFIGTSFFSTKKFNDITRIKLSFNSIEYLIDIKPTSKIIEMKKDTNYMIEQYKKGKLEIKTIYEIIVKEILTHNPSLKYVMNLFGNKEEEQILGGYEDYNSINIIPGYSTRVMILESGIFLNVDLKTKILSNYNCLQLLQTFPADVNRITSTEKQTINDWFFNKTIETIHSNQRFKIQEVSFDRNPSNTSIKKEGSSISLIQFYKQCYNLDLDPSSPLLKVKSKNKNGRNSQFIPPELCRIVGLSDEMIQDSCLIKNITRLTKLNPDDRINWINDITKLMNETKPILKVRLVDGERKEVPQKSSFQIKEEYGLDITPFSEKDTIYGQVMKSPSFEGGEGKEIRNISRTFNVSEAAEIRSICLFAKRDENDARYLQDLIKNAAPGYGFNITKNDYKSINSYKIEDWTHLMEKAIKHNKYNLVIILVDDTNQNLYEQLKLYAQEQKGIITQFIKNRSYKKNGMSVVSNILIQMNSKIGGVSYKVKMSPEIMNKKLMIVGVESSGYEDNQGKFYQSVSFCATINDEFTKYTNYKINVSLEDFDNCNFPIANFMEKSLMEYFKNNKDFPQNVIIYRQGTSSGEKKYLSYEIGQLQKLFNGEVENEFFKNLKIPFYYITVNKKSSLKFYEIEKGYRTGKFKNNDKGIFDNPESGLLVYEQLVNPNRFEFYIQPQKVTQGSATPTCYQVDFGNMDCPEIVPKLTFDLCFLYSNWRGPVRIPSVLKYAEKLAKAKAGVNENLATNKLPYI